MIYICVTVYNLCFSVILVQLSLPNNVWRLIVFAPFLIIIKSPKQRLETYCFCSVSSYYYSYSYYSPFFPCTMNLSSGTTGQNFMKLGGVIDICF
jgi:hypothetical protein